MAKYHIYTDGACSGNPGKGGWATIVLNEEENEIVFKEHDTDDYTTNNRMELKAMLCALQYAAENPNHQFTIYCDSAYVVNSLNSWMPNWAANGWRNSKKQIVENVELMKALWEYQSRDFPNFCVHKCDGHAGVFGNELADAAATNNWARFNSILEEWNVTELAFNYGDSWLPFD